MITKKLPSVAATQITITSAAQNLTDLITTAYGSAYTLPPETNAIKMQAEDGDVRFLCDGNIPTADLGFYIYQSGECILRGETMNNLKLIRAGSSNVKVNIQIGTTNEA